MKSFFYYLICLSSLLSNSLLASNLTGDLRIRLDYLPNEYSSPNNPLASQKSQNSLWWNAQFTLQNSHYIFKDISFDWDIEAKLANQTESANFAIRKAKVNWSLNQKATVSLGIDQQTWGRADELNPTDFAFAQDREIFYLEDKQQRKLSREFVSLEYQDNDSALTLLYFPKSQANTLPALDSIWCDEFCQLSQLEGQKRSYEAAGASVIIAKEKESNHELGIRYTDRIQSLDIGLSYFYGNDHWQRISRSFTGSNEVTLQGFSPKTSMTGLDFALSAAGIAARAEVAYFNKVKFSLIPSSAFFLTSPDGLIDSKVLSSILSIDFHALNSTYFNIQYLYTDIKSNEAILLPTEINLTTLVVSHEWFEPEIKLEIKSSYDRDNSSWFSQLSMQWQINYQHNIVVGYQNFNGDDALGYDNFKNNNSINLTTQYLF